jgi:hypothetical protein
MFRVVAIAGVALCFDLITGPPAFSFDIWVPVGTNQIHK